MEIRRPSFFTVYGRHATHKAIGTVRFFLNFFSITASETESHEYYYILLQFFFPFLNGTSSFFRIHFSTLMITTKRQVDCGEEAYLSSPMGYFPLNLVLLNVCILMSSVVNIHSALRWAEWPPVAWALCYMINKNTISLDQTSIQKQLLMKTLLMKGRC